MKIKIKILTPVHIGSGEEISPLEYFIDRERGNFNRLNMNSLLRDEKFKPFMNKFISEASRSRYIRQIINNDALLRRHVLYSLPISAEARSYLITNPTNVKSFIKSAGRVYLPGSSLKGAILSAVLWYAIKQNYPKQDIPQKKRIETFLSTKRRESQRAYDELLKIVFPWIARVKDQSSPKFANWMDLSDSNLQWPQDRLQISLAKVKGARRGGELPILYESLREGSLFEMEIRKKEGIFSEHEVLKIAHEFYIKVAQRDVQKDSFNIIQEPYLVRVGQGSTAFSTSFLLLAEELPYLRYSISEPRTRKRIADKIPLGFVQIILQ